MSFLSKNDALQLADDIKSARVAGYAIADRIGRREMSEAAFLGGLEAVLCHFLRRQGRNDASASVIAAMNYTPTDAEIADRNAKIGRLAKATS